jgi:hypothetical protein
MGLEKSYLKLAANLIFKSIIRRELTASLDGFIGWQKEPNQSHNHDYAWVFSVIITMSI